MDPASARSFAAISKRLASLWPTRSSAVDSDTYLATPIDQVEIPAADAVSSSSTSSLELPAVQPSDRSIVRCAVEVLDWPLSAESVYFPEDNGASRPLQRDAALEVALTRSTMATLDIVQGDLLQVVLSSLARKAPSSNHDFNGAARFRTDAAPEAGHLADPP